MNSHLLTELRHVAHPHRVLDSDRGGRDLRLLLVVAQRAGVRRGDAQAGGGADKGRDRSKGCRSRGTGGTVAYGAPVSFPVDGVDDDLALDVLATERLELVEAADDDDRRGDAALGGADAAPEAEHRQLALDRRDHVQRLLAAHPVRDHHRLLADRETLGRHRLGRPVDRLRQSGRAAQTMPDHGGQVGETLPALDVGQGRAQNPAGRLRIGGEQILLGVVGPYRGSR